MREGAISVRINTERAVNNWVQWVNISVNTYIDNVNVGFMKVPAISYAFRLPLIALQGPCATGMSIVAAHSPLWLLQNKICWFTQLGCAHTWRATRACQQPTHSTLHQQVCTGGRRGGRIEWRRGGIGQRMGQGGGRLRRRRQQYWWLLGLRTNTYDVHELIVPLQVEDTQMAQVSTGTMVRSSRQSRCPGNVWSRPASKRLALLQ